MSLDKPKIESKYTEEEKAEDFKSEEENGDEGTPPEKASQLTISQIKHFALIKNESDSKSYNMLLHSFNANEFGFMSLEDAKQYMRISKNVNYSVYEKVKQ